MTTSTKRATDVRLIEQPRIGEEPVWYQFAWTWNGKARKSEQFARDPETLRQLVIQRLAHLEDVARMLRSVLEQVDPYRAED